MPYPPLEHPKNISPQLEDKGAKQKSAFARTSVFANYKLFAFANYSCSLLLAPRQPHPLAPILWLLSLPAPQNCFETA